MYSELYVILNFDNNRFTKIKDWYLFLDLSLRDAGEMGGSAGSFSSFSRGAKEFMLGFRKTLGILLLNLSHSMRVFHKLLIVNIGTTMSLRELLRSHGLIL